VRIAHLISGGDLAGGQAIALRLARAARGAGHDVLLVSPGRGEATEAAAAHGIPTEIVDVTRTTRLRGALELVHLLRRAEVDVLHTHVHVAANVLGRSAARAAGAAVISHLHIENHFRRQRLLRAPLVRLDNATARRCARLVAVCEATRAAFERQGFPPTLLETVPNGVDGVPAGPRGALRSELAVGDDVVVFAHVGRLAPVKGQRELIEALASLRDPRLHAVLVGRDVERGGTYEAGLRELAVSLGVGGRVHFAGFRADAAALLSDVDALVLPSWIEGLPLVVLEAMAQARAVVATRVGGTPEAVLDGETGLLVPPGNVEALAAALRTVAESPELRSRLGEAGRQRVRDRFAAATMERRVLEIYDEVARSR
jgi:glycosyltransferase involved in cell wall biosynthesis